MQGIGEASFLRPSAHARRAWLSQSWTEALLFAFVVITVAACVTLLGLRLQKLNAGNGANASGHMDDVSGSRGAFLSDAFFSDLVGSRCLGQPDRP